MYVRTSSHRQKVMISCPVKHVKASMETCETAHRNLLCHVVNFFHGDCVYLLHVAGPGDSITYLNPLLTPLHLMLTCLLIRIMIFMNSKKTTQKPAHLISSMKADELLCLQCKIWLQLSFTYV